MIYAWIGALAVGLSIGLLGSGGSILTVPILVYLLHHDEKPAIAEALAIVCVVASVGAVRAWTSGRIRPRCVLLFGGPGLAGTYVGATLAQWVPGPVQLVVLGAVMLGAAGAMFRQPPESGDDSVEGGPSAPRSRCRPFLVATLGVSVGLVTGLVGVGGGFLIVPALVLLAGVPMGAAIGTSLAIIAINSAVGFGRYWWLLRSTDVAIDWSTIGLFAALGVVGALAGQSVAGRVGHGSLRRLFAAFLVAMAAYILWTELSAMLGGT